MLRTLFGLVLLLPLAPQQAEAFVFRKVVYSSPVEGRIHWGGKPLQGLTVTRELYSGGFEGGSNSDFGKTNVAGRFSLPVVEERRFLRPDLLSANPMITQLMWLTFENRRYSIWSYSKFDFFASEAHGGVLKVNCDLSFYEQHQHSRLVRCHHNGKYAL